MKWKKLHCKNWYINKIITFPLPNLCPMRFIRSKIEIRILTTEARLIFT